MVVLAVPVVFILVLPVMPVVPTMLLVALELPIVVVAEPEVLTLVVPVTVVVELALPMLVAAEPEVFKLVVPVRLVVPLVTVRFLPLATVVSPFRLTAPVPVANVPDEAD